MICSNRNIGIRKNSQKIILQIIKEEKFSNRIHRYKNSVVTRGHVPDLSI